MSPAQTEPIVESMNESSAPGDPFAPLAAAFLHIEDSAIVFSAEGELVVWNPGAERLYGYTFEEARRKDISFLAAPEESGATISLIARVLSGQPVPPQIVDRIGKDGNRVRISLRVSPLAGADGAIFGVLFMGRDIFPEVERENRLTEMQMRERDIAALVPDALYIHRQGKIVWVNEHGPQGGDEINLVKSGANYGWPLVTFGRSYAGFAIGEGTSAPGLEPPLHHWTPSIAPSGMAFYTGAAFPGWEGNLFVGSLKFQYLARVVLDGTRVVSEERLLEDQFGRVRDVRQGPDGFLYLLTDEGDGRLVRLQPTAN